MFTSLKSTETKIKTKSRVFRRNFSPYKIGLEKLCPLVKESGKESQIKVYGEGRNCVEKYVAILKVASFMSVY